jgi:hypothetical protein
MLARLQTMNKAPSFMVRHFNDARRVQATGHSIRPPFPPACSTDAGPAFYSAWAAHRPGSAQHDRSKAPSDADLATHKRAFAGTSGTAALLEFSGPTRYWAPSRARTVFTSATTAPSAAIHITPFRRPSHTQPRLAISSNRPCIQPWLSGKRILWLLKHASPLNARPLNYRRCIPFAARPWACSLQPSTLTSTPKRRRLGDRLHANAGTGLCGTAGDWTSPCRLRAVCRRDRKSIYVFAPSCLWVLLSPTSRKQLTYRRHLFFSPSLTSHSLNPTLTHHHHYIITSLLRVNQIIHHQQPTCSPTPQSLLFSPALSLRSTLPSASPRATPSPAP